VYAYAVPRVVNGAPSVHLLWHASEPWIYAPLGWMIQRREGHISLPWDSEEVTQWRLTLLRRHHAMALETGELTLRSGQRPSSEVFTFSLYTPPTSIRLWVTSVSSHAVGLRNGKTVAMSGPLAGSTAHELWATGIDTVVLEATGLTELTIQSATSNSEDYWAGTEIAFRQLPIRELMPHLDTAQKELQEAQSRLLPGESLDGDEFRRITELLRIMVAATNSRRPIDTTLFVRDGDAQSFTELCALDPLRGLLLSPRWRRALGLGMVDHGVELHSDYHYRIIGVLPDLPGRVHGFHTVPLHTTLPPEFYLDGVRVRLPQPAAVTVADDLPDNVSTVVTRRGIELSPMRAPHWLGLDLDDWSAVIDFSTPVRAVTLEFGRATHSLTYAAGAPWTSLPGPTAVPAGHRPLLSFPEPIFQLRLRGTGFLCAMRAHALPPTPSFAMEVLELPRVEIRTDSPTPQAPPKLGVENLPKWGWSKDTNPLRNAPPEARHALGFDITWVPPVPIGAMSWPREAPPPVVDAAMFQVEHRITAPTTTPWAPLLPDDNLMLGHREPDRAPPQVSFGVDLMSVFPEVAQATGNIEAYRWRDVFDFDLGGEAVLRPVPAPGTWHQYRIRSLDITGRASEWRESSPLQLQKLIPPPMPVGPVEYTDAPTAPRPSGVHARVLVRGAPDLTDAERATLGSHGNAVILRWGWHARQRELDPHATEFRVYATRKRMNSIAAVVTAVTTLGAGRYRVALLFDEALEGNASQGLRLDAGYPFEILDHTYVEANGACTATLVTRVPRPDDSYAVPTLGPIRFPIHVIPERAQAPAWGPRLAVRPLTAATSYEVALFDLLDLRADHARDELLVGVSCADSESYVPDLLEPIDNRPGNESPIAAAVCQGRWQGRPTAVDAPSLAPVAVVTAPEPRGRSIEAEVDVTTFLGGTGLTAGTQVRPERVSADDVFRAYRVEANRVIAVALRPGDEEQDVAIPNPVDQAAILAALGGDDVGALDDRFVVFLAASHPYPDRLYQAVSTEIAVLPHIRDALPAGGARWVYRVRLADLAGNLSSGGITLRGVVRVPSTRAPAEPLRAPSSADDPPNMLRLHLDAGRDVTHLLVFARPVAPGSEPDSAELLRVPGAAASPSHGVRVQLGSGEVLAPTLVKALTDSDVEVVVDPPHRRVTIAVPAPAGTSRRVWACARTRDGITSKLAGSWLVRTDAPPLTAPTLAVTGTPPSLAFTWSWAPPALACDAWLEAAGDDDRFERVSPRIPRSRNSLAYQAPTGARHYRLRAFTSDGRTAFSNVVTAGA
jgi:hypothetical protein